MMGKNTIYFMVAVGLIIALYMSVSVEKKANEEKDFETIKRELGIDGISYDNLEHLVFLYHHAPEQDRKFAKQSLNLAYKIMRENPSDFPREEYRDAAVTHPTPYVMLGIANGYLKTAKNALKLTKGVLEPEGDNSPPLWRRSPQWYYQGAIFYFNLTLKFSEAINKKFDNDTISEIKETTTCIKNKIENFYKNKNIECAEVYDQVFHENK